MISIVSPAEWGIFYIGLAVCVIGGGIAGVVATLWSLLRKRDK